MQPTHPVRQTDASVEASMFCLLKTVLVGMVVVLTVMAVEALFGMRML